MRAVITVIGQDRVGILARVSQACAKVDANILDVTQSVLQDIFVMVMLVDIQNLKEEFGSFADTMKEIEDITHRTHKNTEITRFVIFGKSSP